VATGLSHRRGLAAIAIAIGGLVGPVSADGDGPSVARKWQELLLDSIRRDFGRPTIHARNLFHLSVAMWDAWATYDARATPWISTERHEAKVADAARREAISHAAYRLLRNRFANSPGFATMAPRYDALMLELGCDPSDASVVGDAPAAVGNRIGNALISFGLADGSNQAGDYANLVYQPVNPPLIVAIPGNPWAIDVRRYQPLALQYFVDQNGFPIPGGFPPFLSAEWGRVSPFALGAADRVERFRDGVTWNVYHDPGPPPALGGTGDAAWRGGHEMVAMWSSHLDPADGVLWDISPASMGNIEPPDPAHPKGFYREELGGNAGLGYDVNPVTGLPYATQLVPRGDYARVLAEFWADGPSSETPPGHWFSILNKVMDHPLASRRIGGTGRELDPLEYDVKAYLALGGAMHDTAVSVWSVKGWYETSRPISAIRWMCMRGQSSNPKLPGYHPDGIRLRPGFIEVITPATTGSGGRHAELKGYEGMIAVRAWRGPNAITDPATQVGGRLGARRRLVAVPAADVRHAALRRLHVGPQRLQPGRGEGARGAHRKPVLPRRARRVRGGPERVPGLRGRPERRPDAPVRELRRRGRPERPEPDLGRHPPAVRRPALAVDRRPDRSGGLRAGPRALERVRMPGRSRRRPRGGRGRPRHRARLVGEPRGGRS